MKLLYNGEIDLNRNIDGSYYLNMLELNESENENLKNFKFLLEKKSDPNLIDENKKTILHHFFSKEKLDLNILQLLIEKKANLNILDEQKNAPFHYFNFDNNTEEVSNFLVENRADLNLKDNKGRSFLNSIFIQENFGFENFKVVESMVNADLANDENETILHLYFKKSNLCNKIGESLLKLKRNTNLLNNKGETVSLILFSNRNIPFSLIEIDFEYNIDTNYQICDKNGNSCYSYSLEYKLEERIKFLQQRKVKLVGESLFHQISTFNKENIDFLIENGADISYPHSLLSFPLHYCLSFDKTNEDLFFYLISKIKSIFFLLLYFILNYFNF